LTVVDGQDNGAMTKDFAQRLPPIVARTTSLYVVGWLGVGNTAVGGAKGGIVGAEASLSSSARISSPNAAQLPKPSSMAQISAMTTSTRAKRGAVYARKIVQAAAICRARAAHSAIRR
jgi:hypothetical protein